ncbi:hypothetical protein VP01_3349g4, partial [Puccinia sorghi]
NEFLKEKITDNVNTELKLMFISKMDSVTHNNIVTSENRGSAIKEALLTDIKVVIKKLVNIGINLSQDIFVYHILFKLPDNLQILKQQLMHSDKTSTESTLITQSALVSTKNQRRAKGNHSVDLCWHLHPEKAPDRWQEAQEKWQVDKNKSNINYCLSLVTLWTAINDPKISIVLNSGASAHIFNDNQFFDKLELGGKDVLNRGKNEGNLMKECI